MDGANYARFSSGRKTGLLARSRRRRGDANFDPIVNRARVLGSRRDSPSGRPPRRVARRLTMERGRRGSVMAF